MLLFLRLLRKPGHTRVSGLIRFAKLTCDLPGASRSGAGKVAGVNRRIEYIMQGPFWLIPAVAFCGLDPHISRFRILVGLFVSGYLDGRNNVVRNPSVVSFPTGCMYKGKEAVRGS